MATKLVQSDSAPTPTRPKSTNGVINTTKAGPGDTRIVVIVYGKGQEKIVSIFADVLGSHIGWHPASMELGMRIMGL